MCAHRVSVIPKGVFENSAEKRVSSRIFYNFYDRVGRRGYVFFPSQARVSLSL